MDGGRSGAAIVAMAGFAVRYTCIFQPLKTTAEAESLHHCLWGLRISFTVASTARLRSIHLFSDVQAQLIFMQSSTASLNSNDMSETDSMHSIHIKHEPHHPFKETLFRPSSPATNTLSSTYVPTCQSFLSA
jgi:hypothetical protein